MLINHQDGQHAQIQLPYDLLDLIDQQLAKPAGPEPIIAIFFPVLFLQEFVV